MKLLNSLTQSAYFASKHVRHSIKGPMTALSSKAIAAHLLSVLRQGTTPNKLALTLAVGFCIGCFPIVGTTTALCIAVALASRMNQAVIQVGNYLAFPLQLMLLVPFLRIGEHVFHAAPLTLSPTQLLALTHSAPNQTNQLMRAFVFGQGYAIVAWAILAPLAILLLTAVLSPLLRVLMRRSNPALAPVPPR